MTSSIIQLIIEKTYYFYHFMYPYCTYDTLEIYPYFIFIIHYHSLSSYCCAKASPLFIKHI